MGKLLSFKRITIIYLFFLLLGTVLPMNRSSMVLNDNYTLHIRWDYLLHAIVYLPLPILLGLSLGKRSAQYSDPRRNKYSMLLWVIFITLFTTVFLEALQLVIPYRAFNINDMLANGVGSFIGLVVVLSLRNTSTWMGSVFP